MKHALVLLSALAVAAAQGVTEQIAPKGSYPESCSKQVDGPMWLTVKDVKGPARRDVDKVSSPSDGHCSARLSPSRPGTRPAHSDSPETAQTVEAWADPVPQRAGPCSDGHLVMTLENGVLTDAKDRTGYIASNYQFQFDAPAQAGAIYTAGFSRCGNGSLALGPTATFYKCRSGDFWNLYDRTWAPQCEPVELVAYACDGEAGAVAGGAGQIPDGQVVATRFVTSTVVKPIADGQPQVLTTAVPVPICQIADGQLQGHTTPCAEITHAPKVPGPAPSDIPVSQYSDGQIQVTPPAGGAPPPAPTGSAPAGGGAPPAGTAPPTEGTHGGSPPSPSGTTPPKPGGGGPAPAPSGSTPAQGGGGRTQTTPIGVLVGFVGAIAFL